MPTIDLPNGWSPRTYQRPLWNYLVGGGQRAIEIAHRRWGKDDLALNWTACAAHMRVGTYWHLLPEYSQARKAIWEAVDPHRQRRRIDLAFPHAIRETTREQEMFLKFKNGSTWQVVGSDNYDSLVGSPPVGVVVSEWALADPAAWAYLRPILAENQGWALFITTPRGKNHAEKMWRAARSDPHWFAEISTATDTQVFSEDTLARELGEYQALYGPEHGRALWEQEYMCSFTAASLGAYYALQLEAAEREGRIGDHPWNPNHPVVTSWDLGIGDSTAIWFLQQINGKVIAIDHYEAHSQPLSHYAKVLQDKPYRYSDHIAPHDANSRELGTGMTRAELAGNLGVEFTVAARLPVDDGINAVRQLIPRMWFNEPKCGRGLECLRHYHKEYVDKTGDWATKPVHDWSSHSADALRTFAISTPLLTVEEYRQPDRYGSRERKRARQGGASWMTA